MSIFKANKKYLTLAYQNTSMAEMLSNEQAVIDVNRSILQNIRQERLAESQINFSQNFDGIVTSSTSGALSNIQSGFAEPVEYMYRNVDRMNRINQHYNKAQAALDKYEKQAKKAAQTGAVVGTLTGGLGAVVVGGVTGAGSDYYRGAVNQQMAGLNGAIQGASAGSVAGPWGAVIGAAVGGAAGSVGSIFDQDGRNRRWATATNMLNWSQSNYYGYQFKPVTASNWNLDLSGLGYAVAKFAGSNTSTATQQKTLQAPIYEAGGTRSSYLATGLFTNNVGKGGVYEEAGGTR